MDCSIQRLLLRRSSQISTTSRCDDLPTPHWSPPSYVLSQSHVLSLRGIPDFSTYSKSLASPVSSTHSPFNSCSLLHALFPAHLLLSPSAAKVIMWHYTTNSAIGWTKESPSALQNNHGPISQHAILIWYVLSRNWASNCGKEKIYFFFPLVTYHEHLLELKGKFLINQIYDLLNVQAFARSECKVLCSWIFSYLTWANCHPR